MISSYKFIQKFWLLNEQILKISKIESDEQNEELEIFTNQSINKINQALEKFRYNVIIATYHEIYSYYKKIIENGKNFKNLKNNFQKTILIMIPVIPHLANECLEKLNYNADINWPSVEQKYLHQETNDIVIQVNGKKRGIISVEKDIQEEEIINQIKNKRLIDKYLNDGKIIKTIYVKNRLINYIVKL
jgi:leucyl-tRNA synthetase